MIKVYARAAPVLPFAMVLVIFAARLIGGALEAHYIAYTHSGDLYLMNIERTTAVNLTNTPDQSEQAPAWSPDGQYLLYDRHSQLEPFEWRVCVTAPLNTGESRCLDMPDRMEHRGWLDDSETIHVFNVTTNQFVLASAVTGQYVGDGAADAGDGRYRLIIERQTGVPLWAALRVQDVQTDRAWMLVERTILLSIPVMTQDGSRIVYVARDMRTGDQLFVTGTAEGSTPIQITWMDSHTTRSEPVWSPDGTWIAFINTLGVGNQLYIIRPDGSGLRQLTFDRGQYAQPAWMPSP